MKPKILFLTIAIIFALPAFLLGPTLWPPAVGGPVPTAGQMPFLIIIAAIEALAFGGGIAFFLLGWRYALRSMLFGKLSIPVFLSIVWGLVSWWPHSNLHIHIGYDFQKLIYIEYGFHATLVVATLIIAFAVFKALRRSAAMA